MPRPDLDQLVTVPTPNLSDLVASPSGAGHAPPAHQDDLPWHDEPAPAPVYDDADANADEAVDGEYVDADSANSGGDYTSDEYVNDGAGEPAVVTTPAAYGAGDAEPADSVELLRVWRDLSTGRLIVEIGGQRFGSVAELRGANLERRFQGVMRDLDKLADAPPVPRATRPRPDVEIEGSPTASSLNDDEDLSLSPGTMFRQMTRAAMGQRPEVMEAEKPKSIAEEIEALLQKRLTTLSEFRQRSIHVRPAPDGGVQIDVDGTIYDGIGDVDDDDVRALLGEIVSEWEKRQ
jgi:hypothetical protein